MTEILSKHIDQAPTEEALTQVSLRKISKDVIKRTERSEEEAKLFQVTLMQELEQVVVTELSRHNRDRQDWIPEKFFPIDEDHRIMHRYMGEGDSPLLTPEVRSAMLVNLLTEDNLPAYHRTIADNFGLDGAWGTWTNKWTSEEANHAYAMRTFLDLTHAINPVFLEKSRSEQMQRGYNVEKDPLHTLVYVTFQELATRVSHRNTGLETVGKLNRKRGNEKFNQDTDDPITKARLMNDEILSHIANDENMHMLFYRNLVTGALEIAPDETMQAILDEVRSFVMPGSNIEGFGHHALVIANAGIYNEAVHLKNVVRPILREWNIFNRTDFTEVGELARTELEAILVKKNVIADRFTQKQEEGLYDKLIQRSLDQSAGGIWLPSGSREK